MKKRTWLEKVPSILPEFPKNNDMEEIEGSDAYAKWRARARCMENSNLEAALNCMDQDREFGFQSKNSIERLACEQAYADELESRCE